VRAWSRGWLLNSTAKLQAIRSYFAAWRLMFPMPADGRAVAHSPCATPSFCCRACDSFHASQKLAPVSIIVTVPNSMVRL
jgi:hypothetical protein